MTESYLLLAYDVDKPKTIGYPKRMYIEKELFEQLQYEKKSKDIELDFVEYKITDRRTAIIDAFAGRILLIIIDVKIKPITG